MNYENVLIPQKVITDGGRHTLYKGEVIRYAGLPKYPLAVVVYNNTNTDVLFRVAYNDEQPEAFLAQTLETSGYSLGHAYLINPAITQAYDITIGVSDFNPDGSSLEVYIACAGLPIDQLVQAHLLSNEGNPFIFDGYSKMYCTPALEWYRLKVETAEEGLTGFIFQGQQIIINSLNIAPGRKNLQNLVTIGAGILPEQVSFSTVQGTKWEHELYGAVLQFAYIPVTAANNRELGRISLTPLG